MKRYFYIFMSVVSLLGTVQLSAVRTKEQGTNRSKDLTTAGIRKDKSERARKTVRYWSEYSSLLLTHQYYKNEPCLQGKKKPGLQGDKESYDRLMKLHKKLVERSNESIEKHTKKCIKKNRKVEKSLGLISHKYGRLCKRNIFAKNGYDTELSDSEHNKMQKLKLKLIEKNVIPGSSSISDIVSSVSDTTMLDMSDDSIVPPASAIVLSETDMTDGIADITSRTSAIALSEKIKPTTTMPVYNRANSNRNLAPVPAIVLPEKTNRRKKTEPYTTPARIADPNRKVTAGEEFAFWQKYGQLSALEKTNHKLTDTQEQLFNNLCDIMNNTDKKYDNTHLLSLYKQCEK